MNKLYVGFSKTVSLPKGACLFIDDEPPKVGDWKRPLYFDPLKHSFNPLDDISYRKARELADVLYTISPQGENTLTVRNGKRALLTALMNAERLDKIERPIPKGRAKDTDDEVAGMIDDLLASPILRRVLCTRTNFSFNPNSVICARINRAELGDFDALVLGLFLMSHYKGQVVVPDIGFYGRDGHISLIRENRLIAGVNHLGELSPKLRNSVLLIEEKEASGARLEDAETLASYARLLRGTNGYNDYVQEATA